MTKSAIREQGQIAEAIQHKTAAHPYPPPYPPSWVDRLTDWVERLPGPAWIFYLGAGLVISLTRNIIGWTDGSYPVGTFFVIHILDGLISVYPLFVLHYLDERAKAALEAFRPVLTGHDANYQQLSYEMTTMPTRPVMIFSLVGFAGGLAYLPLFVAEADIQELKYFTSPLATTVDMGLTAISWAMMWVFAYHTIRQLRLVSRIYTRQTNVRIFDTGPLYSLSGITAMTTVALLVFTYVYLAFYVNWQIENPSNAAFGLSFAGVALATFVWPLFGAHRLLQQEKERRKGIVARRMEDVTDELHQRVETRNLERMDGLKDALDGLIAERGVLDKVSTWPWEPEAVRVVLTALFLPVVLWAITRVLERLGF